MTQRQNKSDALLKLKESFDSVGTKFNGLTWQRIDKAMEEYAKSCCEDLRERIADEARLEPLLQVDKDSIRNVEIITP